MRILPWLPFRAIDFIEDHLKPDFTVFEWGSGNSTIWLSERVQKVISVEHDKNWYGKVKKDLEAKNITNVDLFFCNPDKDLKQVDEMYHQIGLIFLSYAKVINEYPNEYFDCILVDGRARIGCIVEAQKKLKRGGLLILDNSDHYEYQGKILDDIVNNWDRVSIFGEGNNPDKWETTLWFKND